MLSDIPLWVSATGAATHCSITSIKLWGEEGCSPPNPGGRQQPTVLGLTLAATQARVGTGSSSGGLEGAPTSPVHPDQG